MKGTFTGHYYWQALSILLIFNIQSSCAQNNIRIEPPFWWAGMNVSELQLLVYADDIALCDVEIKHPGITLSKINKVDNSNYLFLDLIIEKDTKPGDFKINFTKDNKTHLSYNYKLLEREPNSSQRKGFGPSDVIYLLMPDRFANGDPGNDSHPEMLEKADRSNPSGRHGGDIAGIKQNLDYIKDLGFTAVWINPLLENNQPVYSYHGYAITDFYKVDPRFGTNEDYRDLVNSAHNKGLKVIMDMIFNHCGINHWFIKDLPGKGWIHEFPTFTRSNFRAESLSDPYASEYDKNQMQQGWFDNNMPDFDQRNPLVSKYLIQNSIWWIEYAGIDGIRMDTQPYPYKEIMTEWTKHVFSEYPDFNIVGEAWMQRESMTSYYQKDSKLGNGYNSGVSSITDFPMYNAITKAFSEPEGWSEGMARIYYVLAQDFLFSNPSYNLIFADNHDLNRFYTSINKDLDAYKLAMTFLLTTRGIPTIYYGTEFLMEGEEPKGHGEIRKDFPGGWATDSLDFFTGKGKTIEQQEAFKHLQVLLNWRQTNEAVSKGNLKHYIPQNGVYVYFREYGDQRVMVILNNSKEAQSIETSRFQESLRNTLYGTNVMTGNKFTFRNSILLAPRESLVIELNN
jgi:glycosidase